MLDALMKGAGMFMDMQNAERNRDLQSANAANNIALQREFAQHGIKWKVDDAKSAGIHPLYALGASTTSFSPVSIGSGSATTFASDMGSMGQDISRAINATRTEPERADAYQTTLKALQLERGKLENDVLRATLASQVQKINQAGTPPPFPGPQPEDPKTPKPRPRLQIGGYPIRTDPLTSNMEDFETRIGDEGPMNWLAQAAVAVRDLYHHSTTSDPWIAAKTSRFNPRYRRQQLERR